mgnify:FL=1
MLWLQLLCIDVVVSLTIDVVAEFDALLLLSLLQLLLSVMICVATISVAVVLILNFVVVNSFPSTLTH